MRPRPSATLLVLLLALPFTLVTVPRVSSRTEARSDPEPATSRVQVLRDPPPASRVASPRPKPRRIANRSHRTAVPLPRRTTQAAPAPTRTASPAPRATRSTRTTATAPRTSGYPYANDTTGGSDPWGFVKRQCVSYVAWRLSQVGRPVYSRQGWGDARNWDDTARSKGRTVTTRPAVGSVAHWNAGERSAFYSGGSAAGSFVAGSQGHVGWVTKVYADGSVQVAQYNGTASRAYSTMRVKAPRFLRL